MGPRVGSSECGATVSGRGGRWQGVPASVPSVGRRPGGSPGEVHGGSGSRRPERGGSSRERLVPGFWGPSVRRRAEECIPVALSFPSSGFFKRMCFSTPPPPCMPST